MDYDDNDFQSQNLHITGEGSTKFPPVLRPYALPKFDLDESLQGHLRFDSLVETEVFLGIESNEDNQWIDAYSRGSSGIDKPVKNKGKRYPDVYSYDLRFDMAVIESNKRVAWGYSIPLAVGDEVSSSVNNVSSSMIDATEVKLSSGGLFNISYKISLWFNSTNVKNSLLNQSSFSGRISAEGIYDAGAGNLCMVGCRDLLSNPLIPTAHSVDCEIVVKFQLPPLDANNGIFIKGSIGSTRKNSDPLYFKTLELSSAAFYSEAAAKAVWRLDMETIMVLISTTLACVFVGLQIYHVKKHPKMKLYMIWH